MLAIKTLPDSHLFSLLLAMEGCRYKSAAYKPDPGSTHALVLRLSTL